MKPNKWQVDASQFVYERNNSMLLARTGTGKTLTYLLALQDWQESKAIKRAIVSAPLRVCNTVWRQEAIQWQIPVDFVLCTGEMSKHQQEAAIFAADFNTNKDRSPHLLVNHTMLPKILKCDHGCDALIIDELSRFRNPGGAWQKACRFSGIPIATGGTGTPAPNGLTSLYGMSQAVGLGHIWGEYSRNHDKWLRRFFYAENPHSTSLKWVPFKETPQELAELIRPHTYTLEEGAVALPPVVRRTIDVQLPPKLRCKYDEMRATSKLSDEEIIADTAGVVRMKLRQILSGFAYAANGEAVSLEDDYRLQVLKDIVEEQNGQPIIIVYEFKAQLALMRMAWPHMRWIGGGSTGDDKTIEDWNASKVEILGLHPYSAGHGLNLQYGGGCALAWWQIPDDLESYDQTIARLARRGLKFDSVFSYEPCALGTIETAVLASAHGKRKTQDGLWEALRR